MTRHYRTLDAMRGVAALAVVVMHAAALFSAQWFPRGYLAVDLFFALSGFVIAHAYGARLDAGLGMGRFLLLRLVRLYPLYILGVAMGLSVYVGAALHAHWPLPPPGNLAVAIVASALMLPTPIAVEPMHWLSPFNIPGWSLVFEIGANLLLALMWTRLSNRVLTALLFLSGVALATQYLVAGEADAGSRWATGLYGIARTGFAFLLGVALARLPRPAARHSDLALVLPLLLVASFVPGAAWGNGYDLLCIFLLFPTLLFAGSVFEPRSGKRLFALLGLISFAIYALHSPLLPIGNTLLAHVAPYPGPARTLGAAAFVLLLVLVAWAADRLFDRPVRSRLGRWLALPRTAAA